jgi:hypothetical protein
LTGGSGYSRNSGCFYFWFANHHSFDSILIDRDVHSQTTLVEIRQVICLGSLLLLEGWVALAIYIAPLVIFVSEFMVYKNIFRGTWILITPFLLAALWVAYHFILSLMSNS